MLTLLNPKNQAQHRPNISDCNPLSMAKLTAPPEAPAEPTTLQCWALTFLFGFFLFWGVPTSLKKGCWVFLLL